LAAAFLLTLSRKETTMNNQMLQILLDQLIAPLLAGFIFGARLKDPLATDAQIAAEAEGDIRHALRSKLGFLVDVLFELPQFRQPLDAEIAAQVAANQLPPALTALLPSAPATALQTAPTGIVNLAAPLVETPSGSFIQPAGGQL
jgi:hypothetical protein